MNAKKAYLPTSARRNTLEEIEQAIHSLDRNPRMPENIFENSNSSEEGKEDGDDDDIQVVKADIFKFHGQEETSLERQVSEGILKFEYRFEDPMDDDIIEIDVIDKKKRKSSSDMITLDNDEDNEGEEDDEEEEEKDGKWEEEGNVVIWKVEEKKEDKKEKLEEPKSKKFKQFGEGNFFMLAE